MSEEKKDTVAEKTRKEGTCRICGFTTPFNPDEAGFCCPVCGSPSGTIKNSK